MRTHLVIMTKLCLLPILFLWLYCTAQPTDPDFYLDDPCHFPPDSSIDLNGDGIADLIIGSNSWGTDDVPSSGGNCFRQIRTAQDTYFLNTLDYRNSPSLEYAQPGDTLHIPEIELSVQQYKMVWQNNDMINMIAWGYGTHHTAWEILEEPVYIIFKTVTTDAVLFGWFRPGVDSLTGEIRIEKYELSSNNIITPMK